MTGTAQPGSDQERYARLLAIGTNAGLAMLVVLFGIYMLGLVDPHVPHERLLLAHVGAGDEARLATALQQLRARVAALPAPAAETPNPDSAPPASAAAPSHV